MLYILALIVARIEGAHGEDTYTEAVPQENEDAPSMAPTPAVHNEFDPFISRSLIHRSPSSKEKDNVVTESIFDRVVQSLALEEEGQDPEEEGHADLQQETPEAPPAPSVPAPKHSFQQRQRAMADAPEGDRSSSPVEDMGQALEQLKLEHPRPEAAPQSMDVLDRQEVKRLIDRVQTFIHNWKEAAIPGEAE